MPTYEIEVDGRTFEVDAPMPPTAEQARTWAAKMGSTPTQAPTAPKPTTAGMPTRAASGPMPDDEWAKLTTGQKVRQFAKWGGYALASMTGMNEAGREAVDNPKMTLAIAAAPMVAQRAIQALPSATRAGAKFGQVMEKARNLPVDAEQPGQVALRIQELAERGGSMPKVARDFARRVTDPAKGDLTYQEARDFYSNITRLSADEFKRLTPVVRMEIGKMKTALDAALKETAGRVGMAPTYQSAMKEYAQAAKVAKALESTKEFAVKRALPAGGVGAAGYFGYRTIGDFLGGGR